MEQNPIKQFEKWLEEAIGENIKESTAMCLSTVSGDGQPSSRMVLLKAIEGGKFLFYTNYNSQKSHELANNPKCSLTFYWSALERQVNIEGTVVRTDGKTSDEYFSTRPWKSQVGAWASPQSEPISSRNDIMKAFARYTARFFGKSVPRPTHWGGFAVTPRVISFWQGRPNRLHDRIKYTRNGNDSWKIERIAP